jgi:hypothetical protein
MSYGQDFCGAAHRHYDSAEVLSDVELPGLKPGCNAVAGYLYGLAGELAVKHMMRDSGYRPLPTEQRRDDPFYAHFPMLKSLLRNNNYGRRAQELKAIAEDTSLFQWWDTDMRYAPTHEIPQERVVRWGQSAKDLLERMRQ